jgi:hypothetical protein
MSRLLPAALLILAITPLAFARGTGHKNTAGDRSSFGSDITIDAGTTAGDIACAFCSVHLHGDVKGDVAVVYGNVTVDAGQSVTGDVAVLGGDLAVADDAAIGGDVALAAGDLHLSPEGIIRGDRAIASSRLWLLVPFIPLLVLIGLIWLIVWIVRRNRYRRMYYPRP